MKNTPHPQAVLGKHAIIDLSGCNLEILKNSSLMQDILVKAANLADVTIVGSMDHLFSPHGYTAVLVLEESHISLHTWPEFEYVSIDLYSCNLQTDFRGIADFLADQFQAKITSFTLLERGFAEVRQPANKEKLCLQEL